MTSNKDNCTFYRNGSGPVIVDSVLCRRYQRELRGNCVHSCAFYKQPEAPVMPTPELNKMIAMPTMTEVHNELFKQLRRLNDDDLKGEDLKAEVERSKAVTALSQAMINNADLVLKAHIRIATSTGIISMPSMITDQSPAGEED
jgi:hypothetical protein